MGLNAIDAAATGAEGGRRELSCMRGRGIIELGRKRTCKAHLAEVNEVISDGRRHADSGRGGSTWGLCGMGSLLSSRIATRRRILLCARDRYAAAEKKNISSRSARPRPTSTWERTRAQTMLLSRTNYKSEICVFGILLRREAA